jgi:intein-encoded DNA endonuclease-like protein
MKITFAMPEMLVLYSFLIYNQSISLAFITMILGILSRVFCYAQDRENIDDTSTLEISKKEIL